MTMTLLEHALRYARMGRPVFPCASNKKPLTSRGFKDASLDEKTITAWWTDNPHALIGTPTGNGAIVIDVDGEEGEMSLQGLEFTHGPLPPTRTSATGHGRHLWYRVQCAVRNSAGKIADGIDIRGDGGYVILPPSPHPAGTLYRWVTRCAPAELPASWLELLLKQDMAEKVASTKESEPIPAGRRNSTLASIAGTMRRRGMSESAILSALIAENESRCVPPLPRSEVEAIAKSYSRYPAPDVLPSRPRVILRKASDFTPKPVSWLWPNKVALGKLTMIVGNPGLGKSLVTIDIASRLSKDGEFPFDEKGVTGDTIILTAEDGIEDTVRPRIDAAGGDASRIHIIDHVIDYGRNGIPEDRMASLRADIGSLECAIRETGAKLVIVDPISAYMGETDNYNNADVRRVLSPLSAMAERNGVAVLLINHLRKSGGDMVYRASMSIAFTAACRSVWAVVRDDGDHALRRMVPIKNNIAKDTFVLSFRVEDRFGNPAVDWVSEEMVDDPSQFFHEKSAAGFGI